MRFVLNSMAVVSLVLVFAANASAKTIPGCAGSSHTCTWDGVTYYAETSCPGGSCTPATSDTCPGHCIKAPFNECVSDGQCSGSGNACEDTGNIPVCIAGSANAGAFCFAHGDCNDPPGGSCTVGGVPCCSGSGATPFMGDGKIAILGSNSTSNGDTITLAAPTGGKQFVVCGRNGNDIITGNNGDDLIDAGGGNDTVNGGNGTDTIYGGSGDDILDAAAGPFYLGGNDYIDGGDGNDIIGGSNRFLGSGGDNVLIGGPGDDLIVSGSGRDIVKGGDGDDGIATVPAGLGNMADDNVGTLLCGGAGDDYVYGGGPAHQCIDGGSGSDTCEYDARLATTPTSKDVGTARHCETVNGSVIARTPSCGCESE